MEAGLGDGDADLGDGYVEAGLGDHASVVDCGGMGDGCVKADPGDGTVVRDGCIDGTDPLIVPTASNISLHTILHPLTLRWSPSLAIRVHSGESSKT